MRVCMRLSRGPTLSFLGGPAEVQPFGPLRAFLAGELSAASWRPIRSAGWPPACTTPAGGPGELCAPRRCALVALRSRSVERLLSGRKKSRGGLFSAKFDTVCVYMYVVCVRMHSYACIHVLYMYIHVHLLSRDDGDHTLHADLSTVNQSINQILKVPHEHKRLQEKPHPSATTRAANPATRSVAGLGG